MNRLAHAWDAQGEEARYEYNGLGQRTARQTAGRKEAYLLDLTKPYHNLLAITGGERERTFYWDGNVAAMAETTAADRTADRTAGTGRSILHYYLQDELGSPLRVSGYDRDYLTYGYDEFGNDLYDLYNDLEETGIPNPYSRQGEEQPFGYTGYRHDPVSGTYFAQAREYQPKNGRFTAQDVIQGNGAYPETLNRYGYCWNMPVSYVDRDGKIGYYFYDPDMFCEDNVDMNIILEMDLASLTEQYQTEIKPIAMDVDDPKNGYTTFEEKWNSIAKKGEKVDVMVIMTHANDEHFVTESSVSVNETTGEVKRKTEQEILREDIIGLQDIEIGTLYLLGCNMGLTEPEHGNNSLASTFYTQDSRKPIDMIIATDGSIQHGYSGGERVLFAIPSERYHPDGNFQGFKKYQMVNGDLDVKTIDDISVYWGEISSKRYGDEEEECIGGKKIDEKKKKK